jgi:hypothetical protein
MDNKVIKSGVVRWIRVENNDYETFAKDALEHFGCTDMAPYNTYLAKLIHDSDKVSEYRFIIVGNSLFQVGALTDYTETGFMGLFPGEHRDYFTFVSALDESEDLYKNLEMYLAATFEHINSFINTSDLVEKWVESCPDEAKKAINKLSELLDLK